MNKINKPTEHMRYMVKEMRRANREGNTRRVATVTATLCWWLSYAYPQKHNWEQVVASIIK